MLVCSVKLSFYNIRWDWKRATGTIFDKIILGIHLVNWNQRQKNPSEWQKLNFNTLRRSVLLAKCAVVFVIGTYCVIDPVISSRDQVGQSYSYFIVGKKWLCVRTERLYALLISISGSHCWMLSLQMFPAIVLTQLSVWFLLLFLIYLLLEWLIESWKYSC